MEPERCGEVTRAYGRKHVCDLDADHESQNPWFSERHHDSQTGHEWISRPWCVQMANGREGRYQGLDQALMALLPGDILPDGRPGKPVRIVRPGWSGCLVPAGLHRGDGVRIEPFAADDSPAAPADRDRWLGALMRTTQWRMRPRERPLVPNDPDAMERWNDTH